MAKIQLFKKKIKLGTYNNFFHKITNYKNIFCIEIIFEGFSSAKKYAFTTSLFAYGIDSNNLLILYFYVWIK